jgi:hypothetical protein
LQLINTIFKNNKELKGLRAQVSELTLVQKVWQDVAPNALKNQTQAGAIEDKSLTIYALNGAVAAKIKLLQPSLLTKLQKEGVAVNSIKVCVQVQSEAPKKDKPLRNLSIKAADNIHSLAQKLQGSALGDALERLAQRAKK